MTVLWPELSAPPTPQDSPVHGQAAHPRLSSVTWYLLGPLFPSTPPLFVGPSFSKHGLGWEDLLGRGPCHRVTLVTCLTSASSCLHRNHSDPLCQQSGRTAAAGGGWGTGGHQESLGRVPSPGWRGGSTGAPSPDADA